MHYAEFRHLRHIVYSAVKFKFNNACLHHCTYMYMYMQYRAEWTVTLLLQMIRILEWLMSKQWYKKQPFLETLHILYYLVTGNCLKVSRANSLHWLTHQAYKGTWTHWVNDWNYFWKSRSNKLEQKARLPAPSLRVEVKQTHYNGAQRGSDAVVLDFAVSKGNTQLYRLYNFIADNTIYGWQWIHGKVNRITHQEGYLDEDKWDL